MPASPTLGSEAGGASIAESFALPRITNAGEELEQLCRDEFEANTSGSSGFPRKCLPIVKMMAGNHCCVDCGDQQNIKYGSVGYGTLLCKICAYRHATNTEEQSDIKSLTDDHWDLHSILSLFEGGNTQMLGYISDKPRWRAKGKPNKETEKDSEDVVSFKQIYLSKAATAYRNNLAMKVEHLYQNRMEFLKEEIIQREERALRRRIANRNPFINIFEMNDVSINDVPGFFNSGANTGFRQYAVRPTAQKEKEKAPSPVNTSTSVADQLDVIKERINLRRSMRPPAEKEFSRHGSGPHSNSDVSRNSYQEDPSYGHPTASRYLPQSQGRRRRSIELLGEVGDIFIQGNEEEQFVTAESDDFRNTDKPKIREFWLHNQEEQPRHSYAPRSNATLGTYRRLSDNADRRGSGGTLESSRSGRVSQRPQFRLPQTD
jgi:hypothetical protein